jgi:hypothetical protein
MGAVDALDQLVIIAKHLPDKPRVRAPGIVCAPVKVSVEAVRAAHRKPCLVCGTMPEGRRLLVKVGSGRAQHIEVYCVGHGHRYLQLQALTFARAIAYLNSDDAPACVRHGLT